MRRELLGVSRRTVYYRIREGKLRTIRAKCGSQRVLISSIEAVARRDRQQPPARRRFRRRQCLELGHEAAKSQLSRRAGG